MLKIYRDNECPCSSEEKKMKLRCSPGDRRGRRRGRGRVGRGVVSSLPGDRSNVHWHQTNVTNRDRESPGKSTASASVTARRRIVILNRVLKPADRQQAPINKRAAAILSARNIGVSLVKSYFGIFYKCTSSVMGMFKWLRKDFVQWDRNRRNLSSPDRRGLNNNRVRRQTLTMHFERRHTATIVQQHPQDEIRTGEIRGAGISARRSNNESRVNSEAYRSALQAFLDRRRDQGEGSETSDQSPKLSPTDNRVQEKRLFGKNKNNHDNRCNNQQQRQRKEEDDYEEEKQLIPGVPHVQASELFEVGWVAGTEDRYLELISAEWQHTRTALRRSSHPDCFTAVRADLDVLTEIRHPHTLLLMGTTRTDEHGIVAIFESVDCTLYNYVHEQGERVSVQGAARCAGQLADALRHAHARGIIHGAISSHCVFLAASGIAKLGGWELAVRENEPRPYRDWEERLRTEIFRWQAPEMFYGDAPSKACDVYALALLIWEMCTGRVPWSGLNEVEIERQYIHWERGVAVDTYNFPPLLNNLLEAGLQLDAEKRKLDMNRTHRFLRRLELRYEEESPIYVERHANNNNPQIKTFNAPVATSPLIKSPSTTPKRELIEGSNSLMGKKLFGSEKTSNNEIYSNSKYETFVNNDSNECRVKKNTNVYLDSRKKNYDQVFSAEARNGVDELAEKITKKEKGSSVTRDLKIQKRSINVEEKTSKRKNLVPYESSFSEASTATETPNSSSDESANNTMTDLKKLKEILATKRSNFFYGNSSPTNHEVSEISDVTESSPTSSRERILREARGKSCEPCKPASHKINLEPQVCKSPTEYNPTLIKPASHQNQRAPQLNLSSSELRQAILHPQNLNSSSSSFFETSLWRKEKLICLSKMRKQNPEDDLYLSIGDKKTPSKPSGSPQIDSTYTVNNETAGDDVNVLNRDSLLTTETDLTENVTQQTTPLQALKEALDRATNIIRSVTPNTEESVKLSPIESLDTSDILLDDTGVKESIFERLNRSKLGINNADEEIKSIERSTIDDRDSLLTVGKPREVISADKHFKDDTEKSKFVSFGQTSQSLDIPSNDDFENEMKPNTSKIDDSLIQRLHDFTCNDLFNSQTDDANDSVNHMAEKSLISTAMIFLSNKSQEKSCKSCQHRNLLARRRSLPAGLGQFRSNCNASPLGRLPIRRGDVPDSTVEDLYIDDEFGDNLNINMVLLEDEDEPDDQDLLSSLLETSNT